MKEIVVLSGKGGTGKTSISASLAILAQQESIIADCDVDAANLHILLEANFDESNIFYSGELAEIDQELCTKCGLCSEVCQFDAIPFHHGEYRVKMLSCEGCAYCEKVCPSKAISMHKRKSGELYISEIKSNTKMVHAKLDIGADNSGKLVAEVKNRAKEIAKKENKKYVIVDGSPGIGCPVVSSLSGANYVILVTEPTVSGLHDLERLHAVIKRFRIRSSCIINKYDINEDMSRKIEQFLESEDITLLSKIPYDVNFAKAMSEAKTVVEYETPLKQTIIDTWEKIKSEIN